jgi:hypothetical protein
MHLGRPARLYRDVAEVRVGDVWMESAERPLRRSRVMLAMVTPEYLASEWCRREYATFEWHERSGLAPVPLIVPVILRAPNNLPDWISRRRTFDAANLPVQVSAMARPAKAVERWLDDLAAYVAERIQQAPAFDPSWTVGELPTAGLTAPGPPAAAATSDLALDADALVALLETDPRPDAVAAARKLLPRLRRDRDYGALGKLASALRAHDPTDVEATQHAAFALVQTGDYAAAQKLLDAIVGRLPATSPAFAEVTALLGRANQEQFVASTSRRSPAARAALRRSIDAYRRGYQANRRQNLQHGVQLVAMASAGRRHGLATGLASEQVTARKILEQLAATPESLREPWHHAASAELHLALGDKTAFASDVIAYMKHPQRDADGTNALARQLTTVWEIETDPIGASVMALLRAQALSTPGGTVQIATMMTTSSYVKRRAGTSGAAAAAASRLETSFRDDGGRTIMWWRTALSRAQSVGAVIDADGRRWATCFAVRAREVGIALDELVVLTAAHVVASRGSTLKPKDVRVTFDASPDAVPFEVARELWTSAADALDTTILGLRRQPPVDGMPIAPRLPSLESPHRVYVVGHPGGREMSFSLQDNELLDYEIGPTGAADAGGVVRVHYRAATAVGSSGSPVFDDNWRVIALHHASSPALARLNGKPGTYAASEGIWIQSIAAAAAKR